MLPTGLAKLIKKYLNGNKILLLYDLINYANNLIFVSIYPSGDNEQIIKDLAQGFTDLGFTDVIVFDSNYDTYTVSLNQIDYVNDRQIVNFIDCLLNYLDKTGCGILTDDLFKINQLLYKYKFNHYLHINYNNHKTPYKWI